VIVEGGPYRGVATPVVVARAAKAIVVSFPLPLSLSLTLSFAIVVGGGSKRGRTTRGLDSSC
jgi:hypothetical protein